MRVILSLLLLITSPLAHSQEARPVRCRFLSFGGGLNSVIVVNGKGAEIACPVDNFRISHRVDCFATDNKMQFLSSEDKSPLATASIPSTIKEALLVFVEKPKKTGAAEDAAASYRVLVIDDSRKTFPDGGAYIANFYNKEIRFIVGEHKGMLKAGGAHGYAMPKKRDDFNMATVTFEFLDDGKWRSASESLVRFLPGMRYLILAYQDPSSGRPRIKTYKDMEPSAPAEPAEAAP